MLYHGVSTEAAIAMRINSVPRSIAERLGRKFLDAVASPDEVGRPQIARDFLMSLRDGDWDQARPVNAIMSGVDYRNVWARLSGEVV
jgi:hypothetical protein